MEAGARGAGKDDAFGVNIRLPFEAHANSYIDPSRVVNFKYFFTRKLGFVKESHAFAILPGGFGTLDEGFELLTLIQTGKSDLHPIVFLEAEGTDYWPPMIDFIRERQLEPGLISDADLSLFFYTTDAEAASEHIRHFYANYHSQRYAAGRLILRVVKAPNEEQLAVLNEEFGDIVTSGVIEKTDPAPPEVEDNDALEYERVSFVFDRRSFGRLRELVDRLNDLVVTPDQVELPDPMSEEHAERPW